jgi:osmoprotectant transport system permease protein
VPSIAAFFLLLPITARQPHGDRRPGRLHAAILSEHHHGLRNVPEDAATQPADGETDNQILWKVELPLATPEILAGVRIALTTTVGLATLAFFAGGGGLGEQIYSSRAGTGGIFFKSNVVVAGTLAVLLAALGDLLILTLQRLALPWRRAVAT